jgi:hypothetical protein
MNKALDEVRAEETRRMRSECRAPVLKKSRWLLRKREKNLVDEQRFRLRDPPRYNLKTVRPYLLKEIFQQLWDYNSPSWAGKFLDVWRRQTMRVLPHRTNEEDRPLAAPAPGTHPQLLPCSETAIQRRRGGTEQQGQGYHEKILRFPHVPCPRTGPLPLTWERT